MITLAQLLSPGNANRWMMILFVLVIIHSAFLITYSHSKCHDAAIIRMSYVAGVLALLAALLVTIFDFKSFGSTDPARSTVKVALGIILSLFLLITLISKYNLAWSSRPRARSAPDSNANADVEWVSNAALPTVTLLVTAVLYGWSHVVRKTPSGGPAMGLG